MEDVWPSDSKPKYVMTLSLNVLKHLGLGLYSNVPAVLSEVIANAWDADATFVDINIDSQAGRITIKDNGHGMTVDDATACTCGRIRTSQSRPWSYHT